MPGIANPIVSTAEVQTVTVDATGGTFTVTWNGATTSALAFDVSAAAFTTAMDAIADGTGNVVVTGGPGAAGGGTPYTLTWSAGRGNVPAPTTDATSLTGGAGTAVVATTTAGVTALADPWLSVGAHTSPTGSVPDQGDWQWCMTEVAAWMGGATWSDEPANVSPVIAAVANVVNDLLPDSTRQDLKDFLVVAPDGIIDTVDAGKETDREWLAVDWLVRTLLPLWLETWVGYDFAPVSTAADDIAALPAVASGTFDESATLDAFEVAGRAVWDYRATKLIGVFDTIGGGSDAWRFSSVQDAIGYAGADVVTWGYRLLRGGGLTPTGADDGAQTFAAAYAAAEQVAVDLAEAFVSSTFLTGRDDNSPWRPTDTEIVVGQAWMMMRDAVWVRVTASAMAAAANQLGAVRLGTAEGTFAAHYASIYTAAFDQVTTTINTDLSATLFDIIDDLSAY